MNNTSQDFQDYQRIEQALRFLEGNFKVQPSLAEIADSVHLSEFHFQKVFSRWVGISPKRFLQFITKEYAKKLLQSSQSVLDVTHDSGLSSPGRLHDLLVNCEAMTPGEVKMGGGGLTISYGFHETQFGICLLAITTRGICGLKFMQDSKQQLKKWLSKQWPNAELIECEEKTAPFVNQIFKANFGSSNTPIHLHVKGTNFQLKVWEALLRIPFGAVVTYEEVAKAIGNPGAVRAVGTAIGRNPIPYLIPCHRVIRKMGEFGNYGEGPLRKKAILGWEAAKLNAS